MNRKTKILGMMVLTLVVVFLILCLNVNADVHLATGVSVSDIYKDPMTNNFIIYLQKYNFY